MKREGVERSRRMWKVQLTELGDGFTVGERGKGGPRRTLGFCCPGWMAVLFLRQGLPGWGTEWTK